MTTQTALMVTSGLLMEQMNWKVVLKSASMEHGALCVMTCGELKRPMLPVDSWDFLLLVGSNELNLRNYSSNVHCIYDSSVTVTDVVMQSV